MSFLFGSNNNTPDQINNSNKKINNSERLQRFKQPIQLHSQNNQPNQSLSSNANPSTQHNQSSSKLTRLTVPATIYINSDNPQTNKTPSSSTFSTLSPSSATSLTHHSIHPQHSTTSPTHLTSTGPTGHSASPGHQTSRFMHTNNNNNNNNNNNTMNNNIPNPSSIHVLKQPYNSRNFQQIGASSVIQVPPSESVTQDIYNVITPSYHAMRHSYYPNGGPLLPEQDIKSNSHRQVGNYNNNNNQIYSNNGPVSTNTRHGYSQPTPGINSHINTKNNLTNHPTTSNTYQNNPNTNNTHNNNNNNNNNPDVNRPGNNTHNNVNSTQYNHIIGNTIASVHSHSSQNQPQLSVNVKKRLRQTFFTAVEAGDRNAILLMYIQTQYLYPKYDLVNSPNDKGVVPLLVATNAGRYNVTMLLCELGADVNSCDIKGWNALFYACFQGHLSIAIFLIYYHANLVAANPRDLTGKTPLYVAASRGHFSLVQLCLLTGMNVNHVTINNETALIVAARNGHFHVVAYLVASGATLDHADKHGCTALFYALRGQRYDIAEYLISRGSAVDCTDNYGRSITQFSVQQEQYYLSCPSMGPLPSSPQNANANTNTQTTQQSGLAPRLPAAHSIGGDHISNQASLGQNSQNTAGGPNNNGAMQQSLEQSRIYYEILCEEHRENVFRCIQNGLDRRIQTIGTVMKQPYLFHFQQLSTQLCEAIHNVVSGYDTEGDGDDDNNDNMYKTDTNEVNNNTNKMYKESVHIFHKEIVKKTTPQVENNNQLYQNTINNDNDEEYKQQKQSNERNELNKKVVSTDKHNAKTTNTTNKISKHKKFSLSNDYDVDTVVTTRIYSKQNNTAQNKKKNNQDK